MTSVLAALGLRVAEAPLGWVSDAAEVSERLIELADHVEAGETSLAAVRALRREAGAESDLGVLILDNLAPFRVAYGAAQARALRQDFASELHLAMVANGVPAQRVVELPRAAVFAAPAGVVRASLASFEGRFNVLARLHYRREDREQGRVNIGDEVAPLVTVRCHHIPAGAQEAAVLSLLTGAEAIT